MYQNMVKSGRGRIWKYGRISAEAGYDIWCNPTYKHNFILAAAATLQLMRYSSLSTNTIAAVI